MRSASNSDLQEFISASAKSKFTTNTLAQKDISHGDFYRNKYNNLTKNFDKGIEAVLEDDWEEKIRRANAETERDSLRNILDTQKWLKYTLLSIIVVWLVFVAVIVILQGFNVDITYHKYHVHFNLANSVMNMLLGTTTASVFGLYKAVTNYFFKK